MPCPKCGDYVDNAGYEEDGVMLWHCGVCGHKWAMEKEFSMLQDVSSNGKD